MKAKLLLFILCVAAAGCAVVSPDDRADLAFISLERTGCFGSCPIYVVTLYQDGAVRFEGRDYVKKKGVFVKRVDRAAVERLFEKAESIGFWQLQDTYAISKEVKKGDDAIIELPPTDLPTRYVTLRTAKKMKRVQDYWGAPAELRELERLIDATAGVAEWVGHNVTAEDPSKTPEPAP